MSDKHVFSLYTSRQLPTTATVALGNQCVINDETISNRITHILHLREGEEVIVFDLKTVIHLTLSSLSQAKRGVICGVIQKIYDAQSLKPSINLYQGLLKKEAFEEVIYFAAQMGVQSVTPLVTSKVQRSWGGEKEIIRLQKIMIAACEQAKQFSLPVIEKPVALAQLSPLSKQQICSVLFEPHGKPFISFIKDISATSYDVINVFVGPEGGFTESEQQLIATNYGGQCYALTPSILRSQEAVAVSIGSIRSVACR